MILYKVRLEIDTSKFGVADPTWLGIALVAEIYQCIENIPYYYDTDLGDTYIKIPSRMFNIEDLLNLKIKYGNDIKIDTIDYVGNLTFVDPNKSPS